MTAKTASNSPHNTNEEHPIYGLPPTSIEAEVIRGGVEEVLKTVEKYISKPLKKLTLLDCGSGRGEYAAELSKHFKKVVAVEPQTSAYQYARKHFKKNNLEFYNARIEEFKAKEKFDVIVSLTVFEHMSKQKEGFKVMFNCLKKDGVIYLTAPSKYWIFEQHYGLPFLSWLPLPLANKYLKLKRGVDSFEDSSYSKGYMGMKRFFDQFPCKYDFLLPVNEESAYFSCGRKQSLVLAIRKLGIKLIKNNSFFWNFSKGFIMVIKKA